MLSRMTHRGPDGEGRLDRPGLCAGMRRLAVIDLDGGAQPIANEDGRVQVLFNGEIYNYRQLREELRQAGHRFRTESDTEVLVHLWEEHGPQMLQRLHGMFAFCLHDARDGRTFFARDRFGIKPLYYVVQDGVLLFASEIAVLRAQPGLQVDLDPSALLEWFHLQYVSGERTIYRQIKKLLPGHHLEVAAGAVRTVRWYVPESELDSPSPAGDNVEQACSRLRELLRSSVEQRLIADVPVGIFLSGGLDSAIIADLAATAHDGPLRSFSVGFEDGGELDERAAARETAKRVGCIHREWVLSADQIVSRLEERIRHQAEPIADPALIPTHFLAQQAREEVTVVLTGEGADEIFAGYRRYAYQRRLGAVGRIAGVSTLLRPVAALAGRRGQQALDALSRGTAVERHLGWVATIGPDLGGQLFATDALASWNDRVRESFAPYFEGRSELSGQLEADRNEWLPHNLLAKVDLATMAGSLEARVPFLDHRVVEFAADLPDDLKLRGGIGKWILREAFADRLPQGLRSGKKRGFDLPLGRWMRGPLRQRLEALDRCNRLYDIAGLQRTGVRRLVQRHLDGKADYGLPLFSLISMALFLEAYA